MEKILCVRGRRQPQADLMEKVQLLEMEAARGYSDAVMTSVKELVGLGLSRLEGEVIRTAVQQVANVAAQHAAPAGQACPKCPSGQLVRSRSHSMAERARKRLSAERLFRCDACGWRGWLMPLVVGEHPPIELPVNPDLSPLDYALAPQAMDHRASFSPRNLA